MGTICNMHLNCGVIGFIEEKSYHFAFIVSHEMGHSLGMLHDDKTCTRGNKRCIMFSRTVITTKFNNCSYTVCWNNMIRTECACHQMQT